MPRTSQDVEAYLLRLERSFERREDDTYLVMSGSMAVAVRVASPLVLLRASIGPLPPPSSPALVPVLRRLLELNATDLVHASYGLDGDLIVLGASLELDNLDINELEAALLDIDLATVTHVSELRKLYE